MKYQNKNYCRSRISDFTPEDGDIFMDCNFSQIVPHTKTFEGVSGLIFESCNLMNCDMPKDAVVTKCLTVQKDLCSNRYPKRVAKGQMKACPENCEHVINSTEVTINDKVIMVQYEYADKVVI